MKKFLFQTTAHFHPPEEGVEELTPAAAAEAAAVARRADVQKQRDGIKVETSSKTEEPAAEETETETEGEEEVVAEEKVEEEPAKELTAEELKAKVAEDAKEVEKLQRTIDRLKKRVDKTTAERGETAKKLAAAEAALAAKPDAEKVLTEEEVERRSEAKATQKDLERKFTNDCNRLYEQATKIDKEFKAKVDAMAEDVGLIPGSLIGVLAELDNGGEVLSYLTNNIDVAEEMYALSNRPATLGIKLGKLADKLAEASKKPVKAVSKVPNPLTPPGSNRAPSSTAVITGKESMDEFVRKRNAQEAQKQEDRRRGLRP